MLPTLLAVSILGVSVGFQPSVSWQQRSPQTGQLKLQVGVLSEPLQGELSQAALRWALTQAASLGLPASSTLRAAQTQGTRWGASVRLQQQLDGVDVQDAVLVLTLDAQRRVTIISSSLLNYEQALMTWTISADGALRRASLAVPLAALQPDGRPYGGARREVLPVGADAHAGYLAMVPTLSPADNWLVAVDAVTGEVRWKQNRVFHGAPQDEARAYALNPGGLDAGVAVTPTIAVSLTHADGGSMVLADGGGFLNGTQLTAFNCCPNENCSTAPDAGPKRQTGMFTFMGFSVNYSAAVCDRQQRASNDVLVHDAGTWAYAPVDPPLAGPVVQSDPANSDEFSEVHAFFQVNQVFDWVRGLSAAAAPIFPANVPAIGPFKMRDELRVPARKPAVWANVVFPDIQALYKNPQMYCTATLPPTCTINTLGRIDNAAFMPVENFSQIPLPAYQMDVDTLMIFQGDRADFGYDAPVLWHEFGHGVIYATAALSFASLARDSYSANNETGAMHEAFADFLAGAFGNDPEIGTYVGPRIGSAQTATGVRQDRYLRTMDNTFSCPSVLWGEVHQDSQHYSAALWAARQNFFLGLDNGRTFDAAFYASLVSMSPTVDFAAAAAVIVAHVKTAFPAILDADARMQGVFDAKGVTGCDKTLDITSSLATPRPYYGISDGTAAGFAAGTVIPGPYQMKIKVPQGMESLTVSATLPGLLPGTAATKVKLLAKAAVPIIFAKQGGTLINNADLIVNGVVAGSTVRATAQLAIPCGAASEVHFTLGSVQADTVQDVQVSFVPLNNCVLPVDAGTDGGATDAGKTDAGAADAGSSDAGSADDGGSDVKTLVWVGKAAGGPGARGGCGCSGVEAGLGGLAAVALALRRRQRR